MKTLLFRNTPFFPLLVLFFVFATLFPSLRLLTIGSDTSASIAEYLFSILPEIFALIIVFLCFWHIRKNKISNKLKTLDWLVIGFMLSNVIIGTIISQDLMLSAYGIRLTYFPMLFYFVFRFLDIKSLMGSLNLIFIWFFAVAIAGIILYFAFHDVMIWMMKIANPVLPEYFVVRMSSIFWSPVVFSTFMMVTTFYFFHRYLLDSKWIWLLFIAITSFCIIMSMSRGAMVISILGLILMTSLYWNWKSVFPLLTIIGVYLFTAFIIASPGELSMWIFDSTADTVGLKKGTTRVDLWINAFQNFKDHPLGMGLGKAGHVAARFFDENSSGVSIYSTDGWFLKTLNETGIWGLFSYLVFAASFFFLMIKQIIHRRQKKLLLLLLTLFITINIQNMVSNVLDFYLFSFLYWGIIGLSANLVFNNNSEA